MIPTVLSIKPNTFSAEHWQHLLESELKAVKDSTPPKTVVLKKCIRVIFAGGNTRWHRTGIMKELLVEFRRLEREAGEQERGLWGKST